MQPRIIPRSEHPISRKKIDDDAIKVLYRLYRSGHTAFLVGGGVRDLLIGRRPKDFDISTSARPGQVKKLFRNCWLIGRRFRLAHIHFRDHKIVEVSTFRAQPERDELNDEDLLVRQDNTFGSPEEDALRRDFTINGLFYDIASFSLIDYVGGVEDIEAGVIRTIGDPHVRFREDPVRMLRAIKFAARLDFAIEPETWDALCEHAEEITKCSTSRVIEEVARLLEGGASCRSLQLLKASGLLGLVLPQAYEYLYGLPAGPSLQPDSRGGAQETTEAVEAELLLDADEDADPELQERILGVDGHPPSASIDDAAEAADEGGSDGEPAPEGSALDDEAPVDEAAEVGGDDEIDLSGDDDDGSTGFVTPQGTRCAQAPDRGGLLWRMLGAADARIRNGCPMTRPALFATLLQPLVRHTTDWLLGEDPAADAEQISLGLLRPLTAGLLISRRERERVCQILAAQRKFQRANRGFAQALSRKPYFSESLDLFEASVLATGEGSETLAWWRERYPYQVPTITSTGRARLPEALAGEGREEGASRRSRRRRRDRRGDGGRETLSGREGERGATVGDDEGRGRARDDRRRERDEPARERARDDRRRDRDEPARERVRDDRRRERDEPARERVSAETRGPLRRRDARDIERGIDDYDRRDGYRRRDSSTGRSSARGEGARRGTRERGSAGPERTARRTPFREEGYRGPRSPDDALRYYEARVGRDLTPESPRPRREDGRGGDSRRRRRKPSTDR